MVAERYALYGLYKLVKGLNGLGLMRNGTEAMNVVLYHRVNDTPDDSIGVPRVVFDKMMKMFAEKYEVVSLGEIVESLTKKRIISPKALAITFDDGYMDNYVSAAPILAKYGLPACFFVTSGYVGTSRVFPWDRESSNVFRLMNWEQVRELAEMGFEIGAHTVDHLDLGKVPLERVKQQIMISKEEIEARIGIKVKHFAYPFGGRNNFGKEARMVVRESGFASCCSGYGGKVYSETDPYCILRIPNYPNCIEMAMELNNFMTYYDGKMSIRFSGLDWLVQMLR